MKTWTAKQYRAAADKHYKVCILLNKECNNHKDKKCLVSNLFYLGGYVIECTLKYLILCNEADRDKEYKKEELKSIHIWTHSLQQLIGDARDKVDGFSISWNALSDKTKTWDEQVRYDVPMQNQYHECIKNNFWEDVKNVYNTMREIY